MNETLNNAKAAIAAFVGAFTAFLGWRTIMLLVLVALMFLDYSSGTIAARQTGTWKSEVARNGIWHKLGMGLIVIVCAIADMVMLFVCQNLPNDILAFDWPVVIFPMVTVWYILTEIGSIIENAIAMGAPVPSWLPKIIGAPIHAVDVVVEQAISNGPTHEKETAPKVYMEEQDTEESGLLSED